jgi:hypothetical protein
MTTTVHISIPHVADDRRIIVVVRRSTSILSEGTSYGEVVLNTDLKSYTNHSYYVWEGSEIVVREVARMEAKEPDNPANTNAAGSEA